MTDHFKQDDGIERILSEQEDRDSTPVTYDIATYPADYTLQGIVDLYRNNSILIPPYQRKFVWSIKQSSRLIESFLLGLPVPAIFLYMEPESNNRLLVVDGQQRLLSIVYFFEGYFGPPVARRRSIFRLTGLNPSSPYSEKTYSDLSQTDEATYNRFNASVLRAFVIRQLRPRDNTSMFHLFERLNTGGTQLVGQEIRNCIYHGPFNDMLVKLNELAEWRLIFGKTLPDKRQRDIELILRFLALHHDAHRYDRPMKDFLSNYMRTHQSDQDASRAYTKLFANTTTAVLDSLGERPFHIRAGLNAAVFDSVYAAFARHATAIPPDIKGRYHRLVSDKEYQAAVSSATTDREVVTKRLALADKTLFGR
ncbi:MAG TPA: DUF262 domain-containing protein [Armatimonadota bacterium]|nr:DUF262 domain-containing protein [Armatimonadota bacterium]